MEAIINLSLFMGKGKLFAQGFWGRQDRGSNLKEANLASGTQIEIKDNFQHFSNCEQL